MLLSRNYFACSLLLPLRGSFHRTPAWMRGFLFPSKGFRQCHSHPRTGWRQCASCSPLTCRNRWAWDNALGAVPGQSGEPGVAGNSVAVSHRMCCRLLLGYTACRGKRREMLDAQCLWVCRFRRYFGLLLKDILAGIRQDRQQAHTSTCWGFWARANTCWE